MSAGIGLRAFAERARAAPRDGGLHYRLAVGRLCDRVKEAARSAEQLDAHGGMSATLDVNSPIEQLAVSRFDHLRSECMQFTDAEIEDMLNPSPTESEKDPMLAVFDSFSPSRDEPARRAMVGQVLARPDPLLLDRLGSSLALYPTKDARGALHLGGTDYSTNEMFELAAGALALLPCAFGLPCQDTTQDLSLDCLETGGCYQSRFERVKAMYAQGDEVRYRAILELYGQAESAVRRGDVKWFTRPAAQPVDG